MTDNLLALARRTSNDAVAVRDHLKEAETLFAAEERKTRERRASRETREINLIFALDATWSRQHFWEISKDIQASMFSTAARIRGRFATQLVYYSGLTQNGTVASSPWYNHALALDEEMQKVSCQAGTTQIGKVFRHAIAENRKRKINALVLVADACEEYEEDLLPLARELKENNISFFLFDDTKGSATPQEDTPAIFEHVAQAADGKRVEFYIENIHILGEYLTGVIAASTGDLESVEIAKQNARTPEGRNFAAEMARRIKTALPALKS